MANADGSLRRAVVVGNGITRELEKKLTTIWGLKAGMSQPFRTNMIQPYRPCNSQFMNRSGQIARS